MTRKHDKCKQPMFPINFNRKLLNFRLARFSYTIIYLIFNEIYNGINVKCLTAFYYKQFTGNLCLYILNFEAPNVNSRISVLFYHRYEMILSNWSEVGVISW